MMVPAVVLSPGLLLAALWGVTQPVSKSNADPANAENIHDCLISKSFTKAMEMEDPILFH
jgi:hypothetical protein